MNPATSLDYVNVLSPWIKNAKQHLYELPDAPGRICYGLGNHGHWAMQANNTALSAFAVLAADPRTDPAATSLSQDELLHTALSMLRFALNSHHAGEEGCTDGGRWGHSWISALCIERMMHAVEALDAFLTQDDRDILQGVLVSESDWLLDEYAIVAGLVQDNKPESNMWNGALLQRTAMMFPGSPRAAEYREKGNRFLANAISIPADASSGKIVDGRLLSDLHVGANFFDDFACNHHGYLNVGYMVITLSNAAMLHFSCKHLGVAPPELLYHHLYELWELVKACTFQDGRLMRIGGDTRVRYCYCQDYAIPVWLMMRDRFGETDCNAFEAGWLDQVSREVSNNGDGSFLSDRLGPMAEVSPLYYTRLEGDRAVTLSMAAYWRRRYEEFASVPASEEQAPLQIEWHDDYHGACFVRSQRRAASWVWLAGERPQGLCLPVAESDMAEWRTNLAGRVWGMGQQTTPRIESHSENLYGGGFSTCGRTILKSDCHFAEGEFPQDVAVVDIAMAALPDDATTVVLQRAQTIGRVYLREVKGLYMLVPNDLFNYRVRHYDSDSFHGDVAGCADEQETIALGNWANVDGVMGMRKLYGGDGLVLNRPGKRQITVRSPNWYFYASLGKGLNYADEICLGACSDNVSSYDAGTVLFDVGCALRAGIDAGATRSWSAAMPDVSDERHPAGSDVRVVSVTGEDGRDYVFAANLGSTPAEADLTGSCSARGGQRLTEIDTGEHVAGSGRILEAHTSCLLVWL